MKTKNALGPCQPASQGALHAHQLSTSTTHLSGQPLTVAWLGTMGLVALTLLAFLPLLPVYIGYLSVVCVQAGCLVGQLTPLVVQALQAGLLSPE